MIDTTTSTFCCPRRLESQEPSTLVPSGAAVDLSVGACGPRHGRPTSSLQLRGKRGVQGKLVDAALHPDAAHHPRTALSSSSKMSTPVLLNKEYHGLPAPPNTSIPTPVDLLRLCTGEHPLHYNLGLAYPPEAPVFWIKYGSIIWNELSAQAMVHEELRRLGSPVRAPAIYYACELALPSVITCDGKLIHGYKSYAVMEYIPGKTAAEWLESAQDAADEDAVYAHIASVLSELHRIPVPPGSRPAAIDGGRIWHTLFDEGQAPRQYDSVTQLEDHLNLVSPTRPKHAVPDLVSGSPSRSASTACRTSRASPWSSATRTYGSATSSSTGTTASPS